MDKKQNFEKIIDNIIACKTSIVLALQAMNSESKMFKSTMMLNDQVDSLISTFDLMSLIEDIPNTNDDGHCRICGCRLTTDNLSPGLGVICTKNIKHAKMPHEKDSVFIRYASVCKKCRPEAERLNQKLGFYVESTILSSEDLLYLDR